MNKRQVNILWIIAAALAVAVAAVKFSRNDTARASTDRKNGETLFAKFPGAATESVEIQGAGSNVVLSKKDGKWVLPSRDGYPANTTYVNEFLRTLAELKVTRAMEAGASFASRFGMDESSAVPEQRGMTATFKDASGKDLAKISLGKSIDSNPDASSMGGGSVGRYVRNHADESGFYAVKEMFPSVSADPKRWLADGFISPEKIKSITVSQTGKADVAWKLTRDGEAAEFKLDGATATEVLDATATSSLKSLFSYARFEDVVPADKIAARIMPETKRTVILETFEGFTYTINVSAAKPAEAPAPTAKDEEPPSTDNYFFTVDVNAEIPTERKKEEGEKPEDAKTKDTAFTDQQKILTERLAKEKAFAGKTFEVRKSLVETVLSERDALITKATPPTPGEGAANGAVQQMPGGLIARPPVTATTPPVEAVTPPISVPADDENEEQPAESGEPKKKK